MNGQSETKEFKVGDTFTVYTVLNTSGIDGGRIATIAGEQTYTDSLLDLTVELDKDGVTVDNDTVFPITGGKSIGNGAESGTFVFTASEPSMTKPFVFDNKTCKLLVTTYTVKQGGTAEIATKLETLTKSDYNLTQIVSAGSINDGYNFELTSSFDNPQAYILGDIDGNGDADTIDATYIQRSATRIAVPFTKEQLMRGDIDGDGEVTVLDATYIQRYSTRVKTPYPVGSEVI